MRERGGRDRRSPAFFDPSRRPAVFGTVDARTGNSSPKPGLAAAGRQALWPDLRRVPPFSRQLDVPLTRRSCPATTLGRVVYRQRIDRRPKPPLGSPISDIAAAAPDTSGVALRGRKTSKLAQQAAFGAETGFACPPDFGGGGGPAKGPQDGLP